MPWSLEITSLFERKLKILKRQNKKLFSKTLERMEEIQKDYSQAKDFHPLKGNLKGFYAVDVEVNCIIVFSLNKDQKEIKLVNIGSHDEVY